MYRVVLPFAVEILENVCYPDNTKLDIVGLADGSLGFLPAQMLVYQGLLAQLKADNTASTLTATQDEDGAQEKKTKAQKEGDGGAVLGNTIGGAIAGGIGNINKGPLAALCNAATIGVGSAIGAKTGQIAGDIFNDEDKFGKGMVAPMIVNTVGTGTCIGLGKAICGNTGKVKDFFEGTAMTTLHEAFFSRKSQAF